jgi:hypothetical protein
MARFNNPLADVQVAAPCKADWNQMMGDDRARFCGECNLNVYNLSRMTRSDAENLIARNEGRLCVRFYRRGDGSIITKDCPIGLRAIRRRVSFLTKAIASAVLSFMAGVGIHEAVSSSLAALPTGRTMGVMARQVDAPPQNTDLENAPEVGQIRQPKSVMPPRKSPVATLRNRPR